MKVHEEIILSKIDNLNDAYCPLPLSAIPNNMGINLNCVEKISWDKYADGQLIKLTINFVPKVTKYERYLSYMEKNSCKPCSKCGENPRHVSKTGKIHTTLCINCLSIGKKLKNL